MYLPPNKSSLFLGVTDILFVSLVKLIDLNILCLSLSGMYKGIPNWSTGRYPMRADARKQAKNQFSRFTIFVNKGSEGVRETRQAARAVSPSYTQQRSVERWINKTQIQVHCRLTRSLLVNSHSLSLLHYCLRRSSLFRGLVSFCFLRLLSTAEINDFWLVNSQPYNGDVF